MTQSRETNMYSFSKKHKIKSENENGEMAKSESHMFHPRMIKENLTKLLQLQLLLSFNKALGCKWQLWQLLQFQASDSAANIRL